MPSCAMLKVCHNRLIILPSNRSNHNTLDDADGSQLYSLLSEGHEPHCEWRNHQSPEHFRQLPNESTNALRSTFIQRMIQIFKFFQRLYASELLSGFSLRLDGIVSQIQATLGFDVSSNPLMIVDKADVSLKEAAALTSEMVECLHDDPSGAAISMSQGFTAFVEFITVYLSARGKLLPPRGISDMIAGASMLAVCGWTSIGVDQSVNASAGPAAVDLACSVCGREIIMSRMRDRCFDPILQHRPYCAWICSSNTSVNEAQVEGWRTVFERVIISSRTNKHDLKKQLQSAATKRQLVGYDDTEESPERMYKRMRIALKDATALPAARETSSAIV
jgi:hypothetical protein